MVAKPETVIKMVQTVIAKIAKRFDYPVEKMTLKITSEPFTDPEGNIRKSVYVRFDGEVYDWLSWNGYSDDPKYREEIMEKAEKMGYEFEDEDSCCFVLYHWDD